MKVPAIQYSHIDGFSDTYCPLTVTYFVSNDDGNTWVSSGSVYTDLINAASNGEVTIIPLIATFGAGTSTASRKVKVKYTLNTAGTSIEDIFTVTIHPTIDIAILANSQLDTLAMNPHDNVEYTVANADLSVSSISYSVNYPVDPLGLNDFTTTTKPATTVALQYWTGTAWSDITTGNYLTTGVVGLSSTPCMKSGSLDGSTFSFTMSCTDNTKFGTTSTGQDVY